VMKTESEHMQNPDVSVIIVNWNTRDMTCACIQSVYDQQKDASVEIVVVDNASSDDSVEAIRKRFADVVLIANGANKGFAAANNQGIEVATGRYILLLNSDTLVLDQAIDKCVKFADTETSIGVLGCRILNADRTLQPSCFMFPSILNMTLATTYLYKVFPGSRFFAREHMGWWDRNDVRDVEVVTGCFMLIRRDVIDTVGLLDEDYFMYGEETDFCFRTKKAGFRNVFIPDAHIIHYGGSSSENMRLAMLLQTRASILQFLKKRRGAIAYWFGCAAFSLHSIVRIPYWLIKLVVCKSGREASRERIRAYSLCAVRSLLGWQGLSYVPDEAKEK